MQTTRIRSIRGTLNEIRAIDPGSRITRNMIDRAIDEGKIFHTMCGRWKMVDVDEVIAYFSGRSDVKHNSTEENKG